MSQPQSLFPLDSKLVETQNRSGHQNKNKTLSPPGTKPQSCR